MDTATANAAPAASVNTPAGTVNVHVSLPAEALPQKKSLFTWKNAAKVVAVCAVAGGAYVYRDQIGELFGNNG